MRVLPLLSLLLASGLLLSSLPATAAKPAPAVPETEALCASLNKTAAKAAAAKGNKKAARQAKGLKALAGHIEKIATGKLGVNHQSGEGLSALMVATTLGHKGAIRWLVAQGADPNLKDRKGKDSFSRAAKPELKELLQLGSQPGDAELIELTAPPKSFPSTEEVQEIMQKGVSVHALNQALKACFINWFDKRHSAVIKLLLENGAKANALLEPGHMAGLNPEAAYKTFDYQPCYKLIGRVCWSDDRYERALFRELLDLLGQHGVTPRQIANTTVDEVSGSTQLMMAAAANTRTESRGAGCIAWLLAHGADPEVRNKEGKTALDILTEAKSESHADEILAKKALLGSDEAPAVLNAALAAAARGGAADCMEMLLSKGADIRALKMHDNKRINNGVWGSEDASFSSGTSAVFEAKRKPGYVYFSYITNHPLYPMLRDFDSEGSRRVRALLVEKAGEALPELLNSMAGGRPEVTLLMAVAEVTAGLDGTCPPEAVAWLLEHGADPHVRNKDGKTACDITPNEEKKKLLKAAMDKAKK